jgi:hypothetical protein
LMVEKADLCLIIWRSTITTNCSGCFAFGLVSIFQNSHFGDGGESREGAAWRRLVADRM